VSILKEFGVPITAVDYQKPAVWEVADLPEYLDQFIIGDCCLPEILEQAQVRNCRAILLVTNQERVNIEAAFTARSLNPNIRLVVRSSQERLNQLLSEQLGNFVAFEAAALPASAFALAAVGGSTRGLFTLGNSLFRVREIEIDRSHSWCDRRQLYELNTATRHLLSYKPAKAELPEGIHQWNPEARLQMGDWVTYVDAGIEEVSIKQGINHRPLHRIQQRLKQTVAWSNLQQAGMTVRSAFQHNRTLQIAGMCAIVITVLLLLSILMFKLYYPDMHWQEAINIALILALGGYGDVFGGIKLDLPLPWWIQLFSWGLAVTGTVFIGILFALLTERVLAAHFQFLSRRPPVPRQNHIIIIGMGRLGQRVATLLQDLKQSVVGINPELIDSNILPQMPLVIGDPAGALVKANLATAKSLVVLTNDEVTNLETGLLARTTNPEIQLVLRILNPRFNQSIGRLLPYAKALEVHALAAQAFAAAAFGESILSLFRLHNQTMLVTEYQVEVGDTLNHLLLAEVAYGYGVVPILHQRLEHEVTLMPGDDVRLKVNDRLVILATIEGLRRIEQGKLASRQWFVQILQTWSPAGQFEGGSAIARITGCDLNTARSIMTGLPAILEVPLYNPQALRLVRELRKVQVKARVTQSASTVKGFA
ncbi:MAG TPA: NAD-binding protein, partial [Coleofasciculaceae cyanobacterium]